VALLIVVKRSNHVTNCVIQRPERGTIDNLRALCTDAGFVLERVSEKAQGGHLNCMRAVTIKLGQKRNTDHSHEVHADSAQAFPRSNSPVPFLL